MIRALKCSHFVSQFCAAITGIVLSLFLSACSSGRNCPRTEKKMVTDSYYNVTVQDDYRWLDDLKDPAVRKWNDEQNACTRKYLDRLTFLKPIQERLGQIMNAGNPSYGQLFYRSRLFGLKKQPPRNQRFLVLFPSAGDTAGERTIVDPNVLSPAGTTAIDWYKPSRDGRLLAVSLSENGSEDGTLHIFDVETGRRLSDAVPRVQYPTGGGDVEWNSDNSGFYYTRYPQGDERPPEDANFYQHIYYHKLGTPASSDQYVIGKEFPRIAECTLQSTNDGRYLLVSVANGDGGEFAHFLLSPSGQWKQITQFSDKAVNAQFGLDGRLYLLSHAGAPNGKLLALPPADPVLSKASVIIPEGDSSISGFVAGANVLYVVYISGGPSVLRVFDLKGKPLAAPQVQPIASVSELVRLEGDRILFAEGTYLSPLARFDYDPARGAPRKTNLSEIPTVDFSDCEVVREMATSRDGTKIPVNIIRRKGTVLDGQNPTILYAYGGYGISLEPTYESSLKLWLEQGGVYAEANLRGGGEFGEEWHEAGRLTKKQNVFDDFIACAQLLIDLKYTSREKLSIEGGSNGGLLMGAALTQRPDLFRAVVSHVGIYDMLRVELSPNGAFNVTEFGSVKDPEQFKAFYAYSPYHHVKNGAAYPAILLLTGDNDGRVDPANSRKMCARLQAATKSNLPVMLRTEAQAGHGIGTALSTQIAERADVYAFLFDQLGMKYRGK
jgi:prolyl oligopeptidase